MRWATWIATGVGVGYFPIFPGTIGSLVGLFLFLFLQHLSAAAYTLIFLLLFGLGVYSADLSESFFQEKDAGQIVIDEIVAMMAVLFFLPSSPGWWISGFLLFRLFDIAKPPPIRRLERLPGGWGVMIDDLIAAVYTVGVLRLAEGLM
ncbi:MAG: phosphatidylglycerophosphatase A [Nitrospiria bacterium]